MMLILFEMLILFKMLLLFNMQMLFYKYFTWINVTSIKEFLILHSKSWKQQNKIKKKLIKEVLQA